MKLRIFFLCFFLLLCSYNFNFAQQGSMKLDPLPTALNISRPEFDINKIDQITDEDLLDELEFRLFKYFWQEIFTSTGIAYDHSQNRRGKVAATGFELSAICIGIKRKWIDYDTAYQRVLRIVNTFWDDPDDPDDIYVEGKYGLFWHFVNGHTGEKEPVDCVALCDSADFIAGVIVAAEFFKGTEAGDIALKIVNNVDWDKFVHRDENGKPGLLSWGWVPKHISKNYYDVDGLLPGYMANLNDNSLLIYCIALGSSTHPIPDKTWEKYVDSYQIGEYEGYECISTGKLFHRQVPHTFIRFSRKRDRKVDYFLECVNALLADQAFNMKVNKYPPQLWGLTDCFGKDSYSHSGPPGPIMNDGTVGSTAMVGALPFVPEMSLDSIRYLIKTFKSRIWSKYGLTSTANLLNNYVSPLSVGIETGPMICMIENYRTGLIWDLFMQSGTMKNFVKRADLSGVIDDFELPSQAVPYAKWKLRKGRYKISTKNFQHGKKCLTILKKKGNIVLEGILNKNDLFSFHFDQYVSLWVRDLDRVKCSIFIDNKKKNLSFVHQIKSGRWTHLYYKIPKHEKDSSFNKIIINARITGDKPSIDNLSCEYKVTKDIPRAIKKFNISKGKISQTARIEWVIPKDANKQKLNKYILAGSKKEINSYSDFYQADVLKTFYHAHNSKKRRNYLVYFKDPGEYFFRMLCINQVGHISSFSKEFSINIDPGKINNMMFDFEDQDISNWHSVGPQIKLEIVDLPSSMNNKVLRIDYNKKGEWDYIEIDIEPDLIEVFQFITMKVKGKATILGKLYCRDDLSEDLNRDKSVSKTEWTTLKFDTRLPQRVSENIADVKKMYLFIQPGVKDVKGTIYLDDIKCE